MCIRDRLQSARSRVDTALGLRDRAFRGIKAGEGHEPSLAFRRPRQNPVVGDAVAGAPLRVVEGEHARTRAGGLIELPDELLECQ